MTISPSYSAPFSSPIMVCCLVSLVDSSHCHLVRYTEASSLILACLYHFIFTLESQEYNSWHSLSAHSQKILLKNKTVKPRVYPPHREIGLHPLPSAAAVSVCQTSLNHIITRIGLMQLLFKFRSCPFLNLLLEYASLNGCTGG